MKIPEIYRAKWPLALLGEGFLPFAKTAVRSMSEILQGPDAIKDLAMLMTIIDYRRPHVQWYPSLEYLAFTAGTSDEEARASLERLQSKGLITVHSDLGDRLKIDPQGFFTAVEKLTLSVDRSGMPSSNYDE